MGIYAAVPVFRYSSGGGGPAGSRSAFGNFTEKNGMGGARRQSADLYRLSAGGEEFKWYGC